MTLVKSLIKKDKATCFSYDNLVGNMKDGEVGRKLRSQIFAEFFEKHDIDRDFYDTFYSPGIDAVFLENEMPPDAKIKIIKKVVPVHTKSSMTPATSVIAKIWKKDTRVAKEALSRVVKRITIIKRLTIIRKVNDDIEKVADEKQTDDSNSVSFKKLVKIFNLCHLFVPII